MTKAKTLTEIQARYLPKDVQGYIGSLERHYLHLLRSRQYFKHYATEGSLARQCRNCERTYRPPRFPLCLECYREDKWCLPKIAYATKLSAILGLIRYWVWVGPKSAAVYRCGFCDTYHLTSGKPNHRIINRDIAQRIEQRVSTSEVEGSSPSVPNQQSDPHKDKED